MVRKALCGMIAIGALVAAIALAIFSRCQEGHIATCCLAYGHNVGGSIHYAFENGRDSTVYDRLVTMRKRWLSPDFLARVYTRACAECAEAPTNDTGNVPQVFSLSQNGDFSVSKFGCTAVRDITGHTTTTGP